MADCIFCQMAVGEMQVSKLHEDELVFAIKDINPIAPVHVLVIPNEHVETALALGDAHGALLGRMFQVAARVARDAGVADSGYRALFNVGDDAGMTLPHLHLHVIGGKKLSTHG